MTLATIDAIAPRLRAYNPRSDLGKIIKECFGYLPSDLAGELLESVQRSVILESSLSLLAYRLINRSAETRHCDHLYAVLGNQAFCSKCDGRFEIEDYGVVGNKVITTVGVGYLVDAWQNLVEMENQKYHGLGTGSTAEANGDTALVTELTTEYTGNVRATGTTTEASATVFETVATNTLDGTPGAALREHGLFSASTVGVLWDRTVFASITLSSGDGLQSTYDMTASAGG